MPLSEEIRSWSALEQAARVRAGDVSSEELVEIYLERIASVDPHVHAFAHVMAERALEEARRADRARRKGVTAPFLGVPIGVKDLNAARGSFTRFGSRVFERLFVPFDDAVVAQLRRGGFVIIGKTATSELGAMPVTEPDIHPATKNPWDPRVTAGGSSGGAGAAVAADMLPIAQGSDAAGSIRIPASLCHLVGHKPSRGRVANSFGLDDHAIIWTAGPIARNVLDSAALLDVMAGITVHEPHWAPPPEKPFFDLAARAPRNLRVRFATRVDGVTTDPHVEAAIRDVARVLESLGHHVEEAKMISAPLEEVLPIWQRNVAQVPVYDWSLTQPITRWLGEAGLDVTEEHAEELVMQLSARVLAWFGDADAWLTPTVAIAPPQINAFANLAPSEAFARAAVMGFFTAPFNASGQPAISVPVGVSPRGHPIGAQIAGRPLADATVLALARQLEEAMHERGGRTRRAPPLVSA
jgi:amidase